MPNGLSERVNFFNKNVVLYTNKVFLLSLFYYINQIDSVEMRLLKSVVGHKKLDKNKIMRKNLTFKI